MKSLTTPHWIIFDLDDTLALTEQYGIRIFVNTLRTELTAAGKQIPEDYATFLTYLNHHRTLSGCSAITMAAIHGFDDRWVEGIYRKSAAPSYTTILENLKPLPETTASLTALKAAGHHLHVLTLGHADYAEPVLHHLGLHGIFTPHIHTRAFKRIAKPYEVLLATYPELAKLPKIMVEDSPDNLAPAKALGFTTVGIGRKTLGHPAVDHHYPTITGFLDALGV